MKLDDKLGANGDTLYASLMQVHEGLTTDESHALNARLVLMMINEISDPSKIEILLKEARTYSLG